MIPILEIPFVENSPHECGKPGMTCRRTGVSGSWRKTAFLDIGGVLTYSGGMKQPSPCSIEWVLFDFGGVLAEEGFRNGLAAIGRLNGFPEDCVVKLGHHLVHETGFVVGKRDEKYFWQAMRDRAGISGNDEALRNEILSRFILRNWMVEIVKSLKGAGVGVAILSDQTNWLDELNLRYDFFRFFDRVFNSYHMGKSKRDPSQFDDVVASLGIEARRALFVDDDRSHCDRASQRGLNVIEYVQRSQFLKEMARYCPFVSRLSSPDLTSTA
jgi:FMN phosphatase YigB (HAD superfamily)